MFQLNISLKLHKMIKLKYPITSDGFAECIEIDNESILETMNKYNIVVIDVLTKIECEKSVDSIWKEMNMLGNGNLDPNDPTTWINENWPLPEHIYLSNHYSSSHQTFKNMVNPKIVKTFEILFGHKQICPKADRVSIKRPIYVNGQYFKEWELNPLRLHIDRDTDEPYEKYNRRYQGCLALVDCSYDVGSFSCVPGSGNEVRKNPNLWLNLDQGKYVKQGKESGFLFGNIQKIPLKAGSMVIWEKSVAHSNFPNSSDKPRITQFLSYVENTQTSLKLCEHNVITHCKNNPEYLKELKKYNWTEREKELFGLK